ncbi:MAG: YkoP family protein [Chloroflexota bacterium]
MSRAGRTAAPPQRLERVFAWIEVRDRRRYGIKPLTAGGVGGWGMLRHHGPTVVLRDGTTVRHGDRLIGPHATNDALAALTRDGWQSDLIRRGLADLAELAGIVAAMDPAERPVALWGATILWPFAKRAGWEVRERPRTVRVRMEDWYLRGVLRRWAKEGKGRMRRGRGALRTRDCWLSTGELLARHGPGTAGKRPG